MSWEVIPFPVQESSSKQWGEILHDAVSKVQEAENNTPPSFIFKSWKERFVMNPAELSQYMIDLRAYVADSAKYVQEHTGLLEAANDNKISNTISEVANNNHPPRVQEAA